MDLYYAMTNYHVLCCILHKLVFNKENRATLWISSYLLDDRSDMLGLLKDSMVFDDVAVFDEVGSIYHGNIRVTRQMIEDEKNNIMDNINKDAVKELKSFKKLYMCQDTHSLGIYLNENKIKYNFFEDGCGTLCRPEMIIDLVKKESPAVAQIVMELECLGESSNVVHRYGDLSEQIDGYFNKKDIDFSVKKILKILPKEDLKKILTIYKCKKYDLKKRKKSLLLTWPYYRFMTLDEHREFFSLLADYFTYDEEVLFIKPHPSDNRSDYQEWFDGAVIFDQSIPSELLPFCVNGKFDKGITNWSTSIFGLREILKDVVNFDKDIDTTYKDFHKYFAIIKYLDAIKSDKPQKLRLININKKQILQLMKFYIKDYKKYYEIVNDIGDLIIARKYEGDYFDKRCIVLDRNGYYEFENLLDVMHGGERERIYLHNLPYRKINFKKNMKYSNYELLVSSYNLIEHTEFLERENRKKNIKIELLLKEREAEFNRRQKEIGNLKKQIGVYKRQIDGMLGSKSWRITKPLRKIKSIYKNRSK